MNLQKIKRYFGTFLGYQPFSWGSLFLVLGGYWVFFYIGKQEYDHLLVIVGAVAFALILIAFFGTILGAVYISLKLREQKTGKPIEIMEGYSCNTGFSIGIPWWLPLAQCRWKWIEPDVKVQIQSRDEQVHFIRRGSWKEITRKFFISDPFGMFRIYFEHKSTRDLLVKANPGKLEAPIFAMGMQDGGDMPHPMGKPFGDRVDLRMYAPGDPVRYIIWKIYARTGELVVRRPEKALQPAERVLAYLITSPKDSACAGAAQATIKAQSLGRSWRFGADGSKEIVEDKGKATDLITRSANSEDQEGENLNGFIREASDDQFRSLIVFAPPHLGGWVDRVIEASHSVKLMVVIGIDGFIKPKNFARLKNFIIAREDSPYSCVLNKETLYEVLKKLHEANIDVQIADRQTGHVADSHSIQKVLA